MKNFSKYAKVALVLACSLVVTTMVQSSAINESYMLNTSEIKAYEKTVETNNEKSTESTTYPVKKVTAFENSGMVKKSAKKADEKINQKTVTKPTEAPTEKPTEAPTVPIEKKSEKEEATESEEVNDVIVFAETEDTTYQNPTDPPTEWSQELQDLYDAQYDAGYLLAIDEPDFNYSTVQVNLSDEDRKLACQIVYGEAGGEGFEQCCLVAQCLKDSMVSLGYTSIKDVQKYCQYDGWKENYSQVAEEAVDFIFTQNKSAIAHRVLFFYATDLCTSKWHETQNHILTIGNSRFFDMW
ncbi:MAG: hypothetical protein UIM53_02050 [Acutalibacteraceae bacterium]|nr:hypothetical protein [Acutalibacteraceae bacterium]